MHFFQEMCFKNRLQGKINVKYLLWFSDIRQLKCRQPPPQPLLRFQSGGRNPWGILSRDTRFNGVF